MLKEFLDAKLALKIISEKEYALLLDTLREIQQDEVLFQDFVQESESRLAETFELSLFAEHDTWSDYTIDEVDEADHAPISVNASDVSAFQRNSTVLPTFNEERYLDLGLLGKGGMGEVRKVRDTILHRNIAIKIMDPQFSHTHRAIQRFIEEAQVGAQLQHPNIVPIHDFGKMADGRYFFTMKEIKGVEFSELIHDLHRTSDVSKDASSGSKVTLRSLIQIFHTVCETIAYSHSLKVIHRDLKPENIMVGNFGEVLVVDWGIAKVLDTTETDESHVQTERQITGVNQTRFGVVAGTPAYMSPEQAMGRIDLVDERTDIYALGAILYEILSGQPPYQGDSALDILEQVRNSVNTVSNDEPIVLPEIHLLQDETVPPILIQICHQAMARDLSERFRLVTDMASEIWDWLEGARKHDKALNEFVASQEVFEAYEAALSEQNRLWDVANKQYALHGFSSTVTWNGRADLLVAKRHTRRLWREYIRLLDGALVYDNSLPEANRVHAEILIDSIVSAFALGEGNKVYQLEEQFHRYVQNLSEAECLNLQTKLDFEKRNAVAILRVQRGPMIGRIEVLNTIISSVHDGCLVSLIGTAGIGKSRLAIEVAYQLRTSFDCIHFCDLSTIKTELGLLAAVAKSMGLELVNQDPLEQLTQVFINRKTLLVLDNLEHILDDCCNVINHWYQRCPNLRVLTTTRTRLRLQFEKCVTISPLTEFEALELFETRGKIANPSFQVHENNRLILGQMILDLDCLPLAIELAASRLNILTASEIATRLSERFSILRSRDSKAPALEAALDWSWGMLSEVTKNVLAQSSIFLGGFTLDAAEHIFLTDWDEKTPIFDILEDLCENSLLLKQVSFDGLSRFSMLQSIKDYTSLKLDALVLDHARLNQRFSTFYARYGTSDGLLLLHTDREFLHHLKSEQQNCMKGATLGEGLDSVNCCLASLYSVRFTGPSQLGIDFAQQLFKVKSFKDQEYRVILNVAVKLSRTSGYLEDVLKYAERISTLHKVHNVYSKEKTVDELKLLSDESLELGNIAELQADYPKALRHYMDASFGYERIQHLQGLVEVRIKLGAVYIYQASYEMAKQEFEAAYQSALEHNFYILAIDSQFGLSQVSQRQGCFQESLEILEQTLVYIQRTNDRYREIQVLSLLGRLHLDLSDYYKAKMVFQSVLEISNQVGDRKSEGVNIGMKGQAHAQMGEYTQAAESFKAAIEILNEVGDKLYLSSFLSAVGAMYKDLNQYDVAIQYVQQSVDISLEIGDKRGAARTLGNLANIFQNLSQLERALEKYNSALSLGREIGDVKGVCINLGNLGNVYQNMGMPEQAIQKFREAVKIAKEIGDKSIEAINQGNLGLVYSSQRLYDEAKHAMEHAVQITRAIGDRRNEGIFVGNLGDLFVQTESWDQAMINLTLGIEITRDTFPVASGAFLGSLGWVKSQVNRFDEAMAHFEEGETLVEVYPWEYVKFLCKKVKVLRLQNDTQTAHLLLTKSIQIAEGLNVSMDTEVWDSIEKAKLFLISPYSESFD